MKFYETKYNIITRVKQNYWNSLSSVSQTSPLSLTQDCFFPHSRRENSRSLFKNRKKRERNPPSFIVSPLSIRRSIAQRLISFPAINKLRCVLATYLSGPHFLAKVEKSPRKIEINMPYVSLLWGENSLFVHRQRLIVRVAFQYWWPPNNEEGS